MCVCVLFVSSFSYRVLGEDTGDDSLVVSPEDCRFVFVVCGFLGVVWARGRVARVRKCLEVWRLRRQR